MLLERHSLSRRGRGDIPVSRRMIWAEFRTDDEKLSSRFEVSGWLTSLEKEVIKDGFDIAWKPSFTTDEAAYWANRQAEAGNINYSHILVSLEYCHAQDIGFSVELDSTEVFRWLSVNHPSFHRLQPWLQELQEQNPELF